MHTEIADSGRLQQAERQQLFSVKDVWFKNDTS